MGTRHIITVILNGQIKVHQYGQWDGYIDGQGRDIAKFLHNKMDKDKFKKALSDCRFYTKKEVKAFNESIRGDGSWPKKYPHLSRDAGADILTYIQDGGARLLVKCQDSDWCEYFYTINMDNETVNVAHGSGEGRTYTFAQWTEDLMDQLNREEL